MRKLSRVLLAILFISVLSGAAWYFFHSSEPSYNGKPLSFWLEECSRSRNPENYQDVRAALDKIGAEAVPIIIRTLERHDSPMVNKYRESWPTLPGWAKTVLPKPTPENFQVSDAEVALHFVSITNVIPELPWLTRSRNPAVREAAFMYMTRMPEQFLPKDDLPSLCGPGLADIDPFVRQCSAHVLANVGPAASNAIPELMLSFQGYIKGRRNRQFSFSCYSTAKALGKIGPPAAIAFPTLLNELNNRSNDTNTLIELTNALKAIDPEAAAKAGVK